MDYGKTLNLPETEFPMRAGLPQREPDFLKFWEENDIYGKKQALHAGHKKFVLHDGPPLAASIPRMFPAGILTACRLSTLLLKSWA